MPLISVIITTKDEEKNIGNCLKSIRNQTYPQEKLEVIVVDNNSVDKTKEIAKRYANQVFDKGPERSSQRNFGARKAKGKYILYLDADMVLSNGVIEECVNKCEDKNRIALYIPEKIIGDGFWIKVRNFERSFYNGTCVDAVRFVRRDKFLEIGGFDKDLTGPEDWDFDRRIREIGKVGIIESPLYHNEGKFNFKKHLRKKSYYSNGFDRYSKKWGKDDQIVKRQLGFWYRFFGVFTEDRKWRKLVRHPILALGMYTLRVLTGIIYLRSSNE